MFTTKIPKNKVAKDPNFLNHKRGREKDSNHINNEKSKQSKTNHCILGLKSLKNKIKKKIKIIKNHTTSNKDFNSNKNFIKIKNIEAKDINKETENYKDSIKLISSNKHSKFSEESDMSELINKEFNTSEIPSSSNNDLIMDFIKENKDDKNNKLIIIKSKKAGKTETSLKKFKEIIKQQNFESLLLYRFPYISQSEFNHQIYPTNLKQFRKLIFYCPICREYRKHSSMDFHIFEYHFEHIDEYLTEKQIAHGCSKLIKNEYKKIKNSLQFFSELADLFSQCFILGYSDWRINTNNYIEEIKNLNIANIYFSSSNKHIKDVLKLKLPVNICRNKRNKYE